MRRIIIITILSVGLIFASGGYGQPGAFLRFGSSARSLAMGGAYSIVAHNGEALLYNPAGLARLDKWELSLTHAQLYFDSRYEFAAFAYPHRIGNFGLAFATFGATGFGGRDQFNRPTSDFSVGDWSAIIGYGRWVWQKRLQVGFSAKVVSNSVADKSATGFGGVDVGIITQELGYRYRLGLALQNLGAGNIAGDRIPMTIRAGILAKIIGSLVAEADVEVAGSTVKPRVGIEYKISPTLIRAGYSTTEVNVGVGIILDRVLSGLGRFGRPNVDYAAGIMSPVGNDFERFSLSFKGKERATLPDLLRDPHPCDHLTLYQDLLENEELMGSWANITFGTCRFEEESRVVPLDAPPHFDDIYSYFRNGYQGKFGKNWVNAIMTTEGANQFFSQRTHYMYAEAAIHKGVKPETKELIQNLIFVGGDSAQYDYRLQFDLAFCYETLGQRDSAIALYEALSNREDLRHPTRYLSAYRLANLIKDEAPDSAVVLLDMVVRKFGWGFWDENGERISYPMFPKFKDNILAEDALMLMGDIYMKMGGPENIAKALRAYWDILVFYSGASSENRVLAAQKAANAYESLGMNTEAQSMRAKSGSM